jgi:hypothetical protein
VVEKITERASGDRAEQLRRLVGGAVFDAVLETDLLIRARLRQDPSVGLWRVVAVSSVVDRSDGERAATRALVLQPALRRVVPLVVSEGTTEGAMGRADRLGVVNLPNGRSQDRKQEATRWVA